ncbi:MAG: glycosyltransferase [Acidobacteriia bacterium]|nr:glycosyltransferase [Terriglobia bacterium]
MRPYTILQTIETAGPGGAETVLLNLTSHLDPDRFRTVVVLPPGRWLPKQLEERRVPTVIAESRSWHDPTLLRKMAQVIREEHIDLIHSHLPDQNFYSCVVGLWKGRKTIVTYHGAPQLAGNGAKNAFKTWVVRHSAAMVVAVSEYLRRLLIESGFPPAKVSRIYNGVDLDRYTNAPAGRLRAELGLAENTPLVGMVGNIRPSKGYEYFIAAARKVADALPEVQLVAVGEVDPQIGGRLVELVRQFGLEKRFCFLGFRSDVEAVLRDLDVFVLSSTSEGLSIATIEAMAAGAPVVVTRCGGPEEIVEDGRTGCLVPPGDAAALASRIITLVKDRPLALAMSGTARREVQSKFSLAGMVREYEALYDRCLSSD